jgi:segregation and condensation protein B
MSYIFNEMDKSEQKSILETILFVSDETVNCKFLNSIFDTLTGKDEESTNSNIKEDYLSELVDEINQELFQSNRPYKIVNFAGGYQFATRAEWGELVSKLIQSKSKRRLSQAALETLAIIAYKQPISKPIIEEIRGVNSNEVVNSLIEKGFVKFVGRSEAIGKPMLYGTTDDFLKHFGLLSIDELPQLKELEDIAHEQEEIYPESEIIIDVSNETDFRAIQASGIAKIEEYEEYDESEDMIIDR